MSSRLIRLLLVVFAIAIGVAASYLLKTTDKTLTSSRAAADMLRERSRVLLGTISDVRAGQVAYVAQGQGEEFWMSRVSKLLPALNQQMADFKSGLSSPAAQAEFEQAAAAVENFHTLDARAQEYVKGSDALLASDLIFSDGLETMGTAATQVGAALNDELQARNAQFAAERTRELTILGSGAGGVLLVMLLLAFAGVAKRPVVADVVAAPVEPPVVQPAVTPKPSLSPSLSSVAQLCTDLARVQEITQLPALLERAAQSLDATGLILWVADQDGRALRAAMSHGYAEQVVARMGIISCEATNAAAAAYRAAEVRTAGGDGAANGALVVPLMTPGGCIGVLSAEMKGGSEKDAGAQALASILAAQLATLISPPPSAVVLPTAAQA